MSKTPSPQHRHEILFALLAAVAAALCAALAFRLTVPLHAQPSGSTLPDTRALTELVQVDLNTADETALCTLPGVGPQLAARIVEDRRSSGLYVRVEDVTRVPGITQEMVDSWAGQVYVSR